MGSCPELNPWGAPWASRSPYSLMPCIYHHHQKTQSAKPYFWNGITLASGESFMKKIFGATKGWKAEASSFLKNGLYDCIVQFANWQIVFSQTDLLQYDTVTLRQAIGTCFFIPLNMDYSCGCWDGYERVQQKWLCQFWVRPLTALLPDAVWWEEDRPQKEDTHRCCGRNWSSQPKPAFKPATWVTIMDICCLLQNPSRHDNWEIPREKLTQLRSVIPQNWEILIVRLLFQLWNKIFILWQDKKENKNFLSFGLPSPHILHCVFLSQEHYLLNHKKQHSLASTRQFLKDAIPSSSRGVTWWPGLCKLSIIRHLMYSSLSQKSYITVPWFSKGRKSSQSFLRCSSWVIILKFGLKKMFHFLDGLINFLLT